MNPTDAIRYLAQQAEFCGKRALEESSAEGVRMFATRADIYYTLACTLGILFGAHNPINASSLGDADDKARELQS
jgi:hypothetical protein